MTDAIWQLEIELLTDLHTGSGLGGAEIDALLQRDHRGRPLIPWFHFKGLLAEAYRERQTLLGKTPRDATHQRLFGGEGTDYRRRGNLTGTALRPQQNPSSVVWGATALELDERQPREDTLRFVEYLPAGTQLTGEIRLPGADDADIDLVERLLRRLDRLGGERSRGSGRIRLSWRRRLQPLPSPPRLPATETVWVSLRLLFQAVEPITIAATATPGNLIPSHGYLPAGTIKGSLTRWLIEHRWTALAQALLEDQVIATPAYPLPPDTALHHEALDYEARPIPLSYQTLKPPGQIGPCPWWATPQDELSVTDRLTANTTEKLKRPGSYDVLYTTDGGQTWRRHTPVWIQAMRNDTGRALQRRQILALFTQTALAAATPFVGRLIVPRGHLEAAQAWLATLVEGEHWLRMGRGGAPMVLRAWAKEPPPALEAADEPVLYVESDLILRTDACRFHTALDKDALQTLLAELELDAEHRERITLINHLSEETLVHGWNGASGTRRLPAVAIRRGSVARLHCKPEATRVLAEALRRRWPLGVGERALEGHGRLRFGPLPVPTPRAVGDETPPIHEGETLLAQVQDWMTREGFPRFPPSRWQALRQRATTAYLDEWFDQARRQLQKATLPGLDRQLGWLNDLQQDNTPGLLRTLGLAAAKAAQAKTREIHP